MKGFSNTKLIFLQPTLHKSGPTAGSAGSSPSLLASPHRLWLITILSFFTFASLFALLSSTTRPSPKPLLLSPFPPHPSPLPPQIFDALLHYASPSSSTAGGRMADPDLHAIAAVLRRRAPCNLLIFGLGSETLLWRALNHGGRTVFLDESEYYIAHLESRQPGLEAYDVSFTTKVSDLPALLAAARDQVTTDCRPVQNLLFSDCRLAVNDLPNQLYEVPWDVILVDGPRGYSPAAPGRMAAIFSAAVMARSTGGKGGRTDVLVHDYEREVERVCSEEFLCGENLVGVVGQLAHYVIKGGAAARRDDFCFNRTATSAAAATAL